VQTKLTQRLFFALWPPASVLCELGALRDQMLRHVRHAKPVPDTNLHLTLAFLGTTNEPKRRCIEAVADRVLAPAITLDLDTVGFWRRSGVVWCGCENVPPTLHNVHDALVAGLSACGHPIESRPFAAHVTVARNVRHVRRPLPRMLLRWQVTEFTLVKSVTYDNGAKYEILRRWPLGDRIAEHPTPS